jgi:hypothetical protein
MTKSKNRFLYLALLCFLGIIAVLVVDGYLGVYDTLRVRSGEFEQTFEADFWRSEFNFASVGAGGGQVVACRYTIDNRIFSSYDGRLQVTVERNQQTVLSVLDRDFSVGSFSIQEFAFSIDTAALSLTQDNQEFTVVIKSENIERRLILSLSRLPVPQKIAP